MTANVFVPADPADLARFLRDRRLRGDHDQKELAEALCCVPSQVSEWEGCSKQPVLGNAMVWANALGFRVALVPFKAEVTS